MRNRDLNSEKLCLVKIHIKANISTTMVDEKINSILESQVLFSGHHRLVFRCLFFWRSTIANWMVDGEHLHWNELRECSKWNETNNELIWCFQGKWIHSFSLLGHTLKIVNLPLLLSMLKTFSTRNATSIGDNVNVYLRRLSWLFKKRLFIIEYKKCYFY